MLPADRDLLQRIGARIRELRDTARLTQDQVGDRAGFSGKYIGEIEKGIRDLPMSTLRAVVEAGLGLEIESVFTRQATKRYVASHAQDVEVTAELLESLPMRLRRPLLALLHELSASKRGAATSLRAAEARRK